MPGLVGYYSNTLEPAAVEKTVGRMREMTIHKPFYGRDPVFSGNGFSASRTHINVVNRGRQPVSGQNVHVWLDGEIHNRDSFMEWKGHSDKSDAGIMHYLYQTHQDFSFLRQIDGGYAAVIYDEPKRKIHLISDRYCRQHLNWMLCDSGFAWSTEIKSFVAIPGISLEIDREAVEEFINMGHLMGERTWFKNVHLLPAAAVLTYDIASNSVSKKRYWWWDELIPLSGKLDIPELADHVGDLFIGAVRQLSELSSHRPGITLSGGRDSRAVFAAMPENGEPIHVVTFGKQNSLDVKIASKLTKKKKTVHHIHILNEENWFRDRLKGIWWADGQTSFLHMHGIASLNDPEHLIGIMFNGLAGEAIAGKVRQFEMSEVQEYIERMDKNGSFSGSFKERLQLYIESMGCPEVYAYNHRFRNFGLIGVKLGEAFGVRTRMPFIDNRLMDFVYRIPAEYKKSVKLYDTMLLMKFPGFYRDLSWNGLDIPVSNTNKILYNLNRSKFLINRILAKGRLTSRITPVLANYDKWIRSEPERSFFRQLIYSKEALYPEYTDRDDVVHCFEEHMSGKKNEKMLSRYLTFEIWLQQILNQNFIE